MFAKMQAMKRHLKHYCNKICVISAGYLGFKSPINWPKKKGAGYEITDLHFLDKQLCDHFQFQNKDHNLNLNQKEKYYSRRNFYKFPTSHGKDLKVKEKLI